MQTSKRTVRVIARADSIVEILKALGGSPNTKVEMTLEVTDNKDTYRVLSSTDVFDWDFIDKSDEKKEQPICEKEKDIVVNSNDSCNSKEKEKATTKIKEEAKKEIERLTGMSLEGCLKDPKNWYKDEEDTKDDGFYFPNYTLISSIGTDGLIKVIESSWLIAKEYPGIRFGTRLFEEKFKSAWNTLTKEEYLKTDLNKSTTRAMMKLLVDVFYNSPLMEGDLEEAYNDTVARINKNYNSLKSAETLNQVMNILYRA